MISSTKTYNREKYFLTLGNGPTQGLEHTLSAENIYSINFAMSGKKFCLSLHYNGANSYLLMVQKLLNSKRKILKFYQLHYV